ncbi:MAG: acetyltransferase [Candidatus Paracaedibacteraceae bacterium]|nr:acetyltransferase [Candidatus Paracaedibacteraceae bacterium]
MQKTKKAIVFGTGSFAEVVHFMLSKDSAYEVVAFTVSKDTIKDTTFLGLPVYPFESIESFIASYEAEMFIAIGYAKMNDVRAEFMSQAKFKGYKLLSYLSSRAQHWKDTKIGENVFIFENNNLQPFVEIGDGTILWSGNHIGHHSSIGKYCFITSHVVVSGHCRVEDSCFIGVNATIADDVKIAKKNLIGAGALITKNTDYAEVYTGTKATILNKTSDRFFQ